MFTVILPMHMCKHIVMGQPWSEQKENSWFIGNHLSVCNNVNSCTKNHVIPLGVALVNESCFFF